MGKVKRRESTGPDDVLPEDIGRKLVTSILEKESLKRLKTLAKGYSKQAIASYQEKESTFSLLQFACVTGNVQAGAHAHFSHYPISIINLLVQHMPVYGFGALNCHVHLDLALTARCGFKIGSVLTALSIFLLILCS